MLRGEYEVGGILVRGIATGNGERGRNMAFAVEIDGIHILHLGLPGASPTSAILKGIEDVDVLLMPVGGGISLSGKAVTDVMETIDPHIAHTHALQDPSRNGRTRFPRRVLKETGLKPDPLEKLHVTRELCPRRALRSGTEPKNLTSGNSKKLSGDLAQQGQDSTSRPYDSGRRSRITFVPGAMSFHRATALFT